MVFDRVPPTVAIVSRSGPISFLGTVLEVGAAQWNTEGGALPGRGDLDPEHVMRFVRVLVDERLSHVPPESEIIVYVAAGLIGCFDFQYGSIPLVLRPGDRYAFFARNETPRAGITDALKVVEMWPLEPDGSIRTPVEGLLTKAELKSRLSGR